MTVHKDVKDSKKKSPFIILHSYNPLCLNSRSHRSSSDPFVIFSRLTYIHILGSHTEARKELKKICSIILDSK